MKRTALSLTLAATVALVCGSTASAALIPYLNDFSSAGLPNASPAGSWSLDGANDQWDLDKVVPKGDSSATNISNEQITNMGTSDFVMSTRFTMEALANSDSGTGANSIGFAAFAGDASYGGGYYLADWSLREGVETKIRIIELGGDTGTTSVNSLSDLGDIVVGNEYEMRLTGVYNAGSLDMTLQVFDSVGGQIGGDATATDTTPLTGQYFGYRDRVKNDSSVDTELGIDYDYLSIQAVPEPSSALLAICACLLGVTGVRRKR